MSDAKPASDNEAASASQPASGGATGAQAPDTSSAATGVREKRGGPRQPPPLQYSMHMKQKKNTGSDDLV